MTSIDKPRANGQSSCGAAFGAAAWLPGDDQKMIGVASYPFGIYSPGARTDSLSVMWPKRTIYIFYIWEHDRMVVNRCRTGR